MNAVVAGARREVLVLGGWVDLGNLRHGVRCRVVLPDGWLTRDTVAQVRGLVRRGAQVRTVPTVPVDAIVADRTAVIYPRDGAMLTFPGAVTTAAELFERMWAGARPLSAPPDTLSEQERAVLTLLSDGCADESMAVQLGVSVRTVRRRVSDLMTRLGARSRFQAGARAAYRGWLTTA